MGGTKSILTHEDLIRKMKPRIDKLSDKDRRLFDHAVTVVSQESGKFRLESAQVCINFVNTDHTVIKTEDNPESSLVVSYDGYGNPTAHWEKESTGRIVYRLAVKSFEEFLSWLRDLTVAAAGAVGEAGKQAIGWH